MLMCYVDESGYERDGHKLGGIHVLGGNCRLNPILIFGDKA